MQAGPVDLTVTFLSPVEVCKFLSCQYGPISSNLQPDDLVRQSLPFSYMALSAASNDGAGHSVKLYTDISAEWISGDDSLTANWTTDAGTIVTHQVQLQSQTPFTESSDHIQRQ